MISSFFHSYSAVLFNSLPYPRVQLRLYNYQLNVDIMLLTCFVPHRRFIGQAKKLLFPSTVAKQLCGRALNEHKADSSRVNSLACVAARRTVALHLPAHHLLKMNDLWLAITFLVKWPYKTSNSHCGCKYDQTL